MYYVEGKEIETILQNRPLRSCDAQEEARCKPAGHIDVVFRVVHKLFETSSTPHLQLIPDSIWREGVTHNILCTVFSHDF